MLGTPAEIDGAQLLGTGPQRGYSSVQNWTLDARSGSLLNNTQQVSGETVGSSYAYDSSGRLNQDFEGALDRSVSTSPNTSPTFTTSWCPVALIGSPGHPNPARCYDNGSRAKTYDAENRLRSETFSFQPEYSVNGPTYTQTPYGWAEYGAYWEDTSGYGQPANIQAVDYGATSHPMRFSLYHPDWGSANAEQRAWLWDGKDRFLKCALVNRVCQSPSLSLEGLGDYDLFSGTLIRVNDRNRNGQVAMSRTSTGFSGWSDAPSRSAHPAYAPCSNGDYVTCDTRHDGKLTVDGWTLDYESWQGVRTFDPATGQWNVPDAYAGEVHDPMTQKPFMWNHNNSYAYADPSGYRIEWAGDIYDQKAAEAAYSQAIKYFQEHGASAAVAVLSRLRDDSSFTVKGIMTTSGHGKDIFDGATGTLHWDTSQGARFGSRLDVIQRAQSPAMGLLHEAAHALRFATDPKGLAADVSRAVSRYDNAEEQRVIEGLEIPTALMLFEPVRWDHGGSTCVTQPVTGTICG
jgi:hypothetical protein